MLTKVRLDLPFDEEVLAQYEAGAAAVGMGLEAFISVHLLRTKDHVGEHLLRLDAAESLEVRSLLGAKVSTGAKLVEMLRRLLKMNVAGLHVNLTPNQLEQIHWYARSAGKPSQEIAQMIVERAIARELKTR
jgi:hypothetical protein